MKINSNEFQLKLFDKRDAFPFSIVRMPYLSNNMPSTIFYSTLCSELLRIATCTTEKAAFICSAKTLLDRMISQGAQMHRLNKSLKRLYGNHMNTFLPFFEDSNQMIQSILHIKWLQFFLTRLEWLMNYPYLYKLFMVIHSLMLESDAFYYL